MSREPTEMELMVGKAIVTCFSSDPHEIAHVAIRAMREPTAEMITAIARLCAEYAVRGTEPTYPEILAAYIDAASPPD